MKNRFFIGLALAVVVVLSFSSCKKDTFTMTLCSQKYDNGDAKTALDANNKVNWNSGDEVNINGQTRTIAVVESRAVIDNVTRNGATQFYVAYPASCATSVSASGIGGYTMPKTYTYASGVLNAPMAGYANNTGTITMQNLTALLKITMSASSNLTLLDFSVKSSTAGLSGDGSVTFSNGDATWTYEGGNAVGDSTVRMSFGSGLNMGSDCTFYLPVPGISAGCSLTFTVNTIENGHRYRYTKNSYVQQGISKNQIAEMTVNLSLSTWTRTEVTSTGTTVIAYTVDASGHQVYFSTGNLQYQASTGAWRFADHQYDFVGGTVTGGSTYGNVTGSTNNSRGQGYSGWQDLFGWGTSGCGNPSYVPYMTSVSNTDYYTGDITYGNNATYRYDWGYAYSQGTDHGTGWRTLTSDEWAYVITRPNHATKATVAGVVGVILLPDGTWTNPSGISMTITMDNYTTNNYSTTQWTALENAGAIFLPTTGRMGSAGYMFSNPDCQYWTATRNSNDMSKIYCIYSNSNRVGDGSHYVGNAVRLVKDRVD